MYKNRAENRVYLIIVLIILVYCIICMFYAHKKSGFFLDEIYSYGLSNSHYAPFLRDVKNGNITDKILLRNELLNYVVAGENRFDFKSV